jgi:hypothetical protein
VGSETGKGKAAPLGICGIETFGCRCWVFLVLAPACAALTRRLGLLLSALSRLVSHTLSSFFWRSNFGGEAARTLVREYPCKTGRTKQNVESFFFAFLVGHN